MTRTINAKIAGFTYLFYTAVGSTLRPTRRGPTNRFDRNCNVHRVGSNSAWAAMENGDVRNTNVVLVNNFSGEYIVAVIEEDDFFVVDATRSRLNLRVDPVAIAPGTDTCCGDG
jgi:hypothetical protein